MSLCNGILIPLSVSDNTREIPLHCRPVTVRKKLAKLQEFTDKIPQMQVQSWKEDCSCIGPLSSESIKSFDITLTTDEAFHYLVEFLNSLNVPGLDCTNSL